MGIGFVSLFDEVVACDDVTDSHLRFVLGNAASSLSGKVSDPFKHPLVASLKLLVPSPESDHSKIVQGKLINMLHDARHVFFKARGHQPTTTGSCI